MSLADLLDPFRAGLVEFEAGECIDWNALNY